MNRPDPRTFGRSAWADAIREKQQREARTMALACLVFAAVSFGSAFGLTFDPHTPEAVPVILVIAAFLAFIVAAVAAGEAGQ